MHGPAGPDGGGGIVDVFYLLDRLEEVVSSATRLPLSSRVLVDEQEYLDIVDQIRLALPEELKAARRVVAERDQILAEANERADHLLERAEEQVAHRVDDHAIAQAAEQRARALTEQAREDAREVRRQAEEYAFRVFSSLDRRLRQIEGVVREGLAELSPSQESQISE
jgi:hypothetical protein